MVASTFFEDDAGGFRAMARSVTPPIPMPAPGPRATHAALPPSPERAADAKAPADRHDAAETAAAPALAVGKGTDEAAQEKPVGDGATGFVVATAEHDSRHAPEPSRAQTDTFDQTISVKRGDTLLDILNGAGVAADAQDVLTALRTVYDPRKLAEKQQIVLTQSADADGEVQLVGLRLNKSYDSDAGVGRLADGSFQGFEIKRKLTQETARAKVIISSSLYADGKAQGVPDRVMAALIKLFSYDVDFQRELQPGDSFDVVFDQLQTPDGKVARDGDILFAELVLSDRTMRLWRFAPSGGEAAYYNFKGESARKALLKTPIDGARLTSSFGLRKHPILGYSRMHRGVDFGASTGTPIMAAGSGTIEFVGVHNGYGKYVRIRHNGTYSTAYAHMSAFARGMQRGTKVRQGQVIGYVGSTGMATGAHLHYEVLKEGTQINPVAMKLPSGEQLRGKDLARFNDMRVAMDHKLQELPLSTLIAQRQ